MRAAAGATAPFRIPLGQGVAGDVVRSGSPAVVPDAANDPRFLARVDRNSGFETRSLMCVPIKRAGRVIGVMQALNCKNLGDEELELLGALGGLAYAALHRVRGDERVRNVDALLRQESEQRHHFVASRSDTMTAVVKTARTAAKSDATVLLLGESGTGKEVLARMVHHHSKRRDGPFTAVNCVALTPTLLESELFGHEKGAFTGATAQKKGKFETAQGGTLFLDEIGDLAPELQTKLLRVLQERELERVGGNETLRVDVRIVAATNKDLRGAVRNATFREDLFYRLNVITLNIPPLRERREDIEPLCKHFLARACQAVKRGPMQLDEAALAALGRYNWPGNIRELANAMERLAVLTEGDVVAGTDLPIDVERPAAATGVAHGKTELPLADRVDAFRRAAVAQALADAGGNQTRAAQLLGVAQPNLSRMMKRLGLRS